MKYISTFETRIWNEVLLKNKERFKVGEYAIMVPFNNQRVKILEVTDTGTIWIEDEDGHQAEFLIKDFIPEIEYLAKKYNII